ncbi:hypothetical protein GQR58_009519 [Nymphon striatum]|nr:hypothetical protein GQR58_009519 [Nymphon striatum]
MSNKSLVSVPEISQDFSRFLIQKTKVMKYYSTKCGITILSKFFLSDHSEVDEKFSYVEFLGLGSSAFHIIWFILVASPKLILKTFEVHSYIPHVVFEVHFLFIGLISCRSL